MTNSHRFRRTLGAVTALTLAGGCLTLATAGSAQAAAADVVAKLPINSYTSLVVDSAHRHVFVSDSTSYAGTAGTVLVYDFQGSRVTTLSAPSRVGGMVLSPDGSTLYVAERSHILGYDTTTFAQTSSVYTITDSCRRDLALSGGTLWHTDAYTPYPGQCPQAPTTLYGVAPGSSVSVSTGWQADGLLQLAAGPAATNRLYMGQPADSGDADPFLTSYDTSGATPVRGPVRRFADSTGHGALKLTDITVSPDGQHLAVADASFGTRLLNADDLTDAPVGYQPLPAGATASAVAFSGDGTFIARGASASGSTPDLLVQKADPAQGTQTLEFAFDGPLDGDRVAPRGLGWSADGARLFAVTTNAAGNAYWLHIVQPPPAQYDSAFSGPLTQTPQQAVVGEPLGLKGRLELDGPAPDGPVQVQAVRTDADGTHTLAPADVHADGTFTVLDVPDLVGKATYTVSFLGDMTHRPATDVRSSVDVAKAPTSLTLTAPEQATVSDGVAITGTLTARGPALPDDVTLTVRRTDRSGSGELSAVPVAADGTFTVHDLPRTTRYVTYTVDYAGDALHQAGTASATVLVTRH